MGTLVLLIVIGIGIGYWLIKRGAGNAAASGQVHDAAIAPDSADVRAAIDRWAAAHGYERTQPGGELLRYQKHAGAKGGNPTYLDVRPDSGSLHLESYVGVVNPLTRRAQGQMPLSAGGIVLAIPRKLAKRDHNVLRAELGLSAIP